MIEFISVFFCRHLWSVQKHQVGKRTFVFHITEECAIILYFGAILQKSVQLFVNFGANN